MYMIQAKSAIEKAFEQPYFMSDSLSIASWFFYRSHLFLPKAISVHLVEIVIEDGEWKTVPVEPYAEFETLETSPTFSSSVITVYGTVGSKDLGHGTRYFQWFHPAEYRVPADTFDLEKYDAKVNVPTNVWLPYSLFKNWEKI